MCLRGEEERSIAMEDNDRDNAASYSASHSNYLLVLISINFSHILTFHERK